MSKLAKENARLKQALQDVLNPLGYLRRYAEERDRQLNGSAHSIANNLCFVQQLARDALSELYGESRA